MSQINARVGEVDPDVEVIDDNDGADGAEEEEDDDEASSVEEGGENGNKDNFFLWQSYFCFSKMNELF